MMSLILVAMSMTIMICLMFSIMMEKNEKQNQKMIEFECGFNSITINRVSFSLQYFMVMMMFLIFDLEIILIMPSILEEKKIFSHLKFLLLLMMMLMLGLMIEWFYGLLEWTK